MKRLGSFAQRQTHSADFFQNATGQTKGAFRRISSAPVKADDHSNKASSSPIMGHAHRQQVPRR